jgi:hypothetical protein
MFDDIAILQIIIDLCLYARAVSEYFCFGMYAVSMMYLRRYFAILGKFISGGGFVVFGVGLQYSSHVGVIAPLFSIGCSKQ